MRGVTPDIFYGTWAPAGNGDPTTQPLVRHAGLNDCLTVYATLAGVDVNAAEPAVLATLGMDAGAIQAILARRAEGWGNVHLLEYVQSGAASATPQAAGNFQSGSNFQAGGNSQTAGNSMITFRSTARLRLPDGKLSDMRRTVGAQVKYLPWGLEAPYYVMRWYDTAWSH